MTPPCWFGTDRFPMWHPRDYSLAGHFLFQHPLKRALCWAELPPQRGSWRWEGLRCISSVCSTLQLSLPVRSPLRLGTAQRCCFIKQPERLYCTNPKCSFPQSTNSYMIFSGPFSKPLSLLKTYSRWYQFIKKALFVYPKQGYVCLPFH